MKLTTFMAIAAVVAGKAGAKELWASEPVDGENVLSFIVDDDVPIFRSSKVLELLETRDPEKAEEAIALMPKELFQGKKGFAIVGDADGKEVEVDETKDRNEQPAPSDRLGGRRLAACNQLMHVDCYGRTTSTTLEYPDGHSAIDVDNGITEIFSYSGHGDFTHTFTQSTTGNPYFHTDTCTFPSGTTMKWVYQRMRLYTNNANMPAGTVNFMFNPASNYAAYILQARTRCWEATR